MYWNLINVTLSYISIVAKIENYEENRFTNILETLEKKVIRTKQISLLPHTDSTIPFISNLHQVILRHKMRTEYFSQFSYSLLVNG